MIRIFVPLFVALAVGCGGEMTPLPTPLGPCMPPECAPVDSRFSGEWGGLATSGDDGWSANVVMVATGDHLSADGVCPGGEGRIGADGNGDVVDWSGDLMCPYPTNSCPERMLWLTSGQFRLNTDGASILLIGQSIACGEYSLFSVVLDLSRVTEAPSP